MQGELLLRECLGGDFASSSTGGERHFSGLENSRGCCQAGAARSTEIGKHQVVRWRSPRSFVPRADQFGRPGRLPQSLIEMERYPVRVGQFSRRVRASCAAPLAIAGRFMVIGRSKTTLTRRLSPTVASKEIDYGKLTCPRTGFLNQPVHEVRLGGIKAAIWQNQTEAGVRYNVTFERLYHQESEWRLALSFGCDDLLLLRKVADLAHLVDHRTGGGGDRGDCTGGSDNERILASATAAQVERGTPMLAVLITRPIPAPLS